MLSTNNTQKEAEEKYIYERKIYRPVHMKNVHTNLKFLEHETWTIKYHYREKTTDLDDDIFTDGM